MFVRRIICDKWEGVFNNDHTIESPSPEDFDRMLDDLDAQTHTMLTLETGGKGHLAIGGGGGQYVVYATFDQEEFWNLLRPEPSKGIILVNIGGQIGDYSASQVVNKETARRAGYAFLATGTLDPRLRWQKQD